MINKRNLTINTYDTSPLTYRGIVDSTELNDIFNSLKSNALKCVLRTRKTQEKLKDLQNSYIYINKYLSSKVRDLNYQANNLLFNAASGIGTSIISLYDNEIGASGIINSCTLDTNYGQLTLEDDYSWSKITRYDDHLGDKRPTPDVKIYVDDILRPTDDAAYNCLDSLSDTIWLEHTTYADHVIKFQLPKSIKPKINSLKIDFFPEYNSIIKKIEYYSIKGFWETINNYESDGRSIKIYFSPYDYGDMFRITLFPVSADDPIIGISNVDLYLTNYKNNGTATFTFPNTELFTITSLLDLKIDYYIDNNSLINQFSNSNPLKAFLIIDTDEYELPYTVINGSSNINLNIGEIDHKYIKIRFELTEVNLTSPVIRGAVLSYTKE